MIFVDKLPLNGIVDLILSLARLRLWHLKPTPGTLYT